MKRVLITAILLLSLLCIGLAEDGFLRFVIGEIDWFSYQAAQEAALPEGLTERETEIFRAGYASGHFDALHPAFKEGIYMLNTKTKKFHLTSCPATLTIGTKNRRYSTLTPEELTAQGYRPCKECNPDGH